MMFLCGNIVPGPWRGIHPALFRKQASPPARLSSWPRAEEYGLGLSSQEERELRTAAIILCQRFQDTYMTHLAVDAARQQVMAYEVVFIRKDRVPVELRAYSIGKGLAGRRGRYSSYVLRLAEWHTDQIARAYFALLLKAARRLIHEAGGSWQGTLPVKEIAGHDILLVPLSRAPPPGVAVMPAPLHPLLKPDVIALRFRLHAEEIMNLTKGEK